MKPAELCPILGVLTVALILVGLMASVFAGLHKAGVVIAASGLVAAGAWAVTRFVEWDTGPGQ